jgi:ethanolamine utilization protein EutN
MYLGRVVGCVWATVKSPGLLGLRMLVVQPLTPELRNTGKPIICTDSTGAGSGEMVYWVRGKEASFPFLPAEPPTDTTIVGIVDSVHLKPVAPAPAPSQENSRPGRAAPAKPGKGKPC